MSNSLTPDLAYIKGLDVGDLITRDTCDTLQLSSSPSKGIDEDPVTGSANCMLVPYWAERLGKNHRAGSLVYGRSFLFTVKWIGFLKIGESHTEILDAI